MSRQLTSIEPDPALSLLRHASDRKPAVLLHSGRFDERWARKSIYGQPTVWYRFSTQGGSELFDTQKAQFIESASPFTHNVWSDLKRLLRDPRFEGPWFGYLSYDLCRWVEPAMLELRSSRWPLVQLGWCPQARELECRNSMDERLERADTAPNLRQMACDFTRPAYEAAVRRVLDYIAAGDVFQVNLAQRFSTDFRGDPRDLYARLATVSPAWYGAYLELPNFGNADKGTGTIGSRTLVSTSPELFLEVKNGHVITRPIKGTRPSTNHATRIPDSDPSYQELLDSAKDAAELHMIVDLMRNDLGRVCDYGSVRVTEPRRIETHPTVHHGVATIEGRLHPTKDVVDLLRATMPGGSVTGAPKVRAMQVIDELEPNPRGPYCGAIGRISRDDLQLNIAIRTMLLSPTVDDGTRCEETQSDLESEIRNPKYGVEFSVGCGIVADSDPAAEYEESVAKAAAIVAALRSSAGAFATR